VRRRRAEATGERAAGRQRRLARILDAAEELFATHGFAKTSVDEIAARAGVSKGLVYDHYPSKEALLGVIWERLVAAWTEAVRSSKYPEGSTAEAIGELLHVSLGYVRDNPLLRRIIAQDPGALIPGGLDSQVAFARQYRASLEPILARGVRRGELRRNLDVTHTAEVLWLLHFTLTRELFVGPHRIWRSDAEELLRAAVDLVVAGLRRPSAGRVPARSPVGL
jgi:AcrR family transcriptional regulator